MVEATFLLTPLLAAVGITGFVGQALSGIITAVGLGLASRALSPKQSAASVAGGTTLTLSVDPNTPRYVGIGEQATAGSLSYWQVSGADDRCLDLVFALLDHECDGLAKVFVAGKEVTLGEEVVSGSPATVPGGQPVSEYPGAMWIKFHNGAWDQDADAELVARSGGKRTSNSRGRGVCYVRVTMLQNADLYPSGIPDFRFVVRGAKLYDPRLDDTAGGEGDHRWGTLSTYAYSANSVLAWYNWRRGIYVGTDRVAGMSTPGAAIPLDSVVAEAAICDEAVELAAGGTEPRYRCNGIFPVTAANRDVIDAIALSAAARLVDTGGTVKMLVGAARAPVMTVTDDDILADADYEIVDKRAGTELVNAVFGQFADPAHLYEMMPLPPRTSVDDEALDGGMRLDEDHDLAAVTSPTQGQRITEIIRRRHRQQGQVATSWRAKLAQLEAGDWINYTSARRGFTNRLYEVVSSVPDRALCPAIVLRETANSVYAWNTGLELDIAAPGNLPAGGNAISSVQGLSVTAISIDADGVAQHPALQVAWTPIEDWTVTAVVIQYRKVGETVAQEYRVAQPEDGAATILGGVQGNVAYEVRALLVTEPPRAVTWTAWTAAPSSSPAQVVHVAATAEAVPPDTITPDMLSPQARFELELMTRTETILGSLSHAVQTAFEAAQQNGAASLESLLQANNANLQIRVVNEVIGNMAARWAVQIDGGGRVIGRIKLDGTLDTSSFDVLADAFTVSHPDLNGGDPMPVFVITEIEGTPTLMFNGDLIAKSITAGLVSVDTLSAITGNVGELTAGVIRSADNSMVLDLDNGTFEIMAPP